MASSVLVYDSDCGPCTDFKNLVSFLDPGRKLSFASMADADELGLLDSVPLEVRYKSFHIVTPGQTAIRWCRGPASPHRASYRG